MSNRNGHNLKVVWALFAGLLAGGLAGATAMLLLAPQSGKKTRSQIRKKSRDLRDQTRDKASQITDDVRDRAGELQKGGQDMIDGQRDHLSNTLEGWGKAVHS